MKSIKTNQSSVGLKSANIKTESQNIEKIWHEFCLNLDPTWRLTRVTWKDAMEFFSRSISRWRYKSLCVFFMAFLSNRCLCYQHQKRFCVTDNKTSFLYCITFLRAKISTFNQLNIVWQLMIFNHLKWTVSRIFEGIAFRDS